VAEVVLSWALQRNMSVIPRSSKKHHIAELANLLTREPFLEEEDLAKIDAMNPKTQQQS
jgi:diketogulonate reductase-like aldo/keto reductase